MARLFTPSESKYYLMALDAGTGSIRAVIFDSNSRGTGGVAAPGSTGRSWFYGI